VARLLESRGFVILFRNLRLGMLELDLVAQREDLVVVVEVRSRGPGSYQKPLESVTPAKRATLLRAVERLWRVHLAAMAGVERLRIDVAGVTPGEPAPRIEYIEGAITG
jgi:putative endonuclease